MRRRRFIQFFLSALGLATAASLTYPLLRFLSPPGGGAQVRKITLKKDEIPVGEAKEIVFNNIPALIINRPGKGFIALSKVCTHLGCLVSFEKEKGRLLCPCHAGAFDLEGNVTSGPPPKPLARFPLHVEGENIVVG